MTGAAGYMALVLAEAVAGSLAFLWCVPLWNEVKRGFFTLTSSILLVLAVAAWWSAKVALVPGEDAGLWSVRLALATAVAVGVTFLLMLAKQQTVARVVGLLSVPLSIAVLVAMAGTGRQAYALSLFQLLAGAAFLGTILDGLLLGHWYLTDRGLPRGPINRYTTAMLIAVGVEAVAVISGGFSATADSGSLNPLLTAGRARAVDRAGHGGHDGVDRGAHARRAQGRTRLRRAVGHRLLLPRGRDGLHRGGRLQDQVPGLSDAVGRHGRRAASPRSWGGGSSPPAGATSGA